MRKGCLIAVAILAGAVLLVGYLVKELLIPAHPIHRAYVWSGMYMYVRPAVGRPVSYAALNKKGLKLQQVQLSAWRGVLAYWSTSDTSVCMLSPTGKASWWAGPSDLSGETVSVGRIYLDGRRVFLNVHDSESRPICVYVLDMANRTWSKMQSSVSVRCDVPGMSRLAVLDSKGDITVRDGIDGPVRRRIHLNQTLADWDCDFSSGTAFYFVPSRQIGAIRRDGTRVRFRLPLRYIPEGIAWQPECRELWVSVSAPFSTTGFVVYTQTGKLVGSVENLLGPYEYPRVATPALARALSLSALPSVPVRSQLMR